jgi:hypothetical protein
LLARTTWATTATGTTAAQTRLDQQTTADEQKGESDLGHGGQQHRKHFRFEASNIDDVFKVHLMTEDSNLLETVFKLDIGL